MSKEENYCKTCGYKICLCAYEHKKIYGDWPKKK